MVTLAAASNYVIPTKVQYFNASYFVSTYSLTLDSHATEESVAMATQQLVVVMVVVVMGCYQLVCFKE